MSGRPLVLAHVAVLAAALGLGLASRLHPIGWWPWDKSLGDVVYAVAAYVALALLFRAKEPRWLAVVALVTCEAIETFQLTGIPLRFAHHTLVRWVLGTTFAWHDVACYGLGVAAMALVDVRLRISAS